MVVLRLEPLEPMEILLQSLVAQVPLLLLRLELFQQAVVVVLGVIFFRLRQVAMVVLEAVDQVCLLLQEVQHRHLVKGLLVATV